MSLDTSPTIDLFALGGTTGTSTLQGGSSSQLLTVVNGMSINPTGDLDFGQPLVDSFHGSLSVGGTLTNSGSMSVWNGSVSAANVSNPGRMGLYSDGGSTFNVTGTLTNQGAIILGLGTGSPSPAGPLTSIGTLLNNGSLFIGLGTTVTLTNQPNGITDIPTGSMLDIQGTLLAGANDALRI